MTTPANDILLPYLEDTGLDSKKNFTPLKNGPNGYDTTSNGPTILALNQLYPLRHYDQTTDGQRKILK